jgi:hypothetical protein
MEGTRGYREESTLLSSYPWAPYLNTNGMLFPFAVRPALLHAFGMELIGPPLVVE